MTLDDKILFGDKSSFAIVYRPYNNNISNQVFAYCHFILDEHLIGSSEESCQIGTWTLLLDKFKNHLISNRTDLNNKLFHGLSENEIFELICKSNQMEHEFNPIFHYLPVHEELWGMHLVRLDETQDAYSIVVIEDSEQLKFIWKGWRNPCPSSEIGKIFSSSLDYDEVILTIEECLAYFRKIYTELKIGLK